MHRPAGRRRRWSLRTRLLVSSISLIALVCAVVGVVTAVALQQELYGQLDRQLVGVADRAQHLHPPGGGVPDGGGSPPDPLDFVIAGGQGIGTLGAVVVDGQVVEAKVSTLSAQHQPTGVKLTGDAQKAALAAVPHDTAAHTVDIPGRGSYRVRWAGATLLVGQPTADQQQAMDRLIVAEICVSLGALGCALVAPWSILVVLLGFPAGLLTVTVLAGARGRLLVPVLAGTGLLELAFGVLLGLGLAL